MSNIQLIQSYEDRLIAKDKSVCFYEMMDETYKYLSATLPVIKKTDSVNGSKFYDNLVDDVIGFINRGYGIKTAFNLTGKRYHKFHCKLSQTQKDLITKSKEVYNIKKSI